MILVLAGPACFLLILLLVAVVVAERAVGMAALGAVALALLIAAVAYEADVGVCSGT